MLHTAVKPHQNSDSLLPEKVHFAIELPVPGEALLGEVAVALAALDALGVPGSVQHVEEEPVQDGPFAPGTVDHHVSGLQDAECRPSHTDCAARTGATRVYAEQRLGSGEVCCQAKSGGSSPISGVTIPGKRCSPAPVWLLSWHLSQSTIQRRGGEISAAPADGLRNGHTGHVFSRALC